MAPTGDKNCRQGQEGAFCSIAVHAIHLLNGKRGPRILSDGFSPNRTHKAHRAKDSPLKLRKSLYGTDWDKNGRSGPEGAARPIDVRRIQLLGWESARWALSAGVSPARRRKALF